ncbi:2-phosphosulfolactate phosphatase [bacterium]|nr:MAG: 2-phosphosulfolactate phosphatase [bacterium]
MDGAAGPGLVLALSPISCPGRRPHHLHVDIIHATGVEGARQGRGVVVVIDVLRSFTVSAYALAGGAKECLLVPTVAEARTLAARTPGAVLSAEEEALPVKGIAISNSPTQIHAAALEGRVLIQRSSAGVPVIASVPPGLDMFAASLVVARATVAACIALSPSVLTLVASADHPEDHACARYMEAIIRRQQPDIDRLLQPLRESARYARAISGAWPGFPPTDLDLALVPDRFDFAMPVVHDGGCLRLTKGASGLNG